MLQGNKSTEIWDSLKLKPPKLFALAQVSIGTH